jgi:hypothetical protein
VPRISGIANSREWLVDESAQDRLGNPTSNPSPPMRADRPKVVPHPPASSECFLLVLPDGRLLARNLTPELSALLMALQPEDSDLALRAKLSKSSLYQPQTPSDS